MRERIRLWRARMGVPYKVIIMEEESLLGAGTFRYTLGKLWLGVGLLGFLLIFVTGVAIFYTPFIREKIPGYTRPDDYEKQEELLGKLEEMEQAIAQRDSFLASLQRMSGSQPVNTESPNLTMNADAEEMQAYQMDGENEETHENPVGSSQVTSAVQRETRGYPLIHIAYNKNKESYLPGKLNLIPPVDGFVTSEWQPSNRHFGIDLASGKNALVKAVAEGTVICADYSDQNGYVIGIQHFPGLITFYKHNQLLFKKTGSRVYAGEAIAIIGNSGENSSGPHLHFEMWYQGQPLNPIQYFPLL